MQNKLKSAGFTEEQAEALAGLVNEQLTTKRDLRELEIRLKHDLTIRLGGMMITGIAIVATLVKFYKSKGQSKLVKLKHWLQFHPDQDRV